MRSWNTYLALYLLCGIPTVLYADPATINIEALRNQVSEHHSKAQHQVAIDVVNRALTLLSSQESAAAAELLLIRGDSQVKAGQPKLAFQSDEQAWRLRERLFGPGDSRTLDALNEYLDTCPDAGFGKACEPIAADAVRQYEAFGNQNAPGLAALLRSHALIVNGLGRASEAVPLLDRAIEIWRQNGERFDDNILNALAGTSVLLINLGKSTEALKVLDELLPLQRSRLGELSRDVLASLNSRAGLLRRMGEIDAAVIATNEVWQLRVKALGSQHLDTLTSLISFGRAQLQVGRIAESIETLGSAGEQAERLHGRTNRFALLARYYQALAMRQGGLYHQSVELLTRIVDNQLEITGERHPDFATYLSALGTALQDVDDIDGALSKTDRSVQIAISLQGATHPETLAKISNALSVKERAGRPPSLNDVAPVVLAMTEKVGPEHPFTLAARHLQALLVGSQGNLDESLTMMQAVAETRVRLLGASHIDTMRSTAALGSLFLKAERHQDALTVFSNLAPRVNELRRSLVPLGPAAQRQTIQQFQSFLSEHAALLARYGKLDEAFAAIDSYKARSLLNQLAQQRAIESAGLPEELAQRLRQLAAKIASLESLAGNATTDAPRETLLESLRLTHLEFDAALRETPKFNPQFSQLLELAPATVQDLTLLGQHSALLHFLKGFDDRWYALVGLRSGRLRWFELGVQPGLPNSVEALRVWTSAHGHRFATDEQGRALRIYRVDAATGTYWLASHAQVPCETTVPRPSCLPLGAVEVRSEAEFNALRKHLGERLLAPLLPAIANAQHLLVSPAGPLALLPWDALLVQDKSTVHRWSISLTPSLSVLKATRLRLKPPARLALLAMAASEGGASDDKMWSPLPNAAREARGAVALFREQGVRAMVGKEASEVNLRQLAQSGELARYRRILISAHGRFESSRSANNAIILARTGDTPETDGVVNVADWLAMRLNSDLTILSACDTARGQIVAGEGLVGFGYTLNVAGNRDLLATLWQVNDKPAADFVLEFLGRIKQGRSHVEALALTKRAFSRHTDAQLRNPRVWGAFVLIGG